MTIESYNNVTGDIIFTEALRYYHWGQSKSTEGDYNGVDMRGEVILLSRNVRIVGDDTDSWGGQIVISDSMEMDGTFRTPKFIMENVEVYNCSQRNTFKSAIRFEMAATRYHSIIGSVVWGGLGWAFSAQYSKNIFVGTTSFLGSRAIGLAVIASSNVTIDDVLVGDTSTRPEIYGAHLLDKEGCFSICAYFGPDPGCSDVHVLNSNAVGCTYAGFVVPGHDCDDSENQDKFRNNVAHSIDGGGAFIFPDVTGNGHSACYEGSHFSAYKCDFTGLATHFTAQEIRMVDMTMIDNVLGITILADGDSLHQKSVLKDSNIYGETAALDCPHNHPCFCPEKTGMLTFSGQVGDKPAHITETSPFPMHHIHSYANWASEAELVNVAFRNFE